MDRARSAQESGQAFLPHRPPTGRHKSDGSGQLHETIRQSRTGKTENLLDRVAISTDESPALKILRRLYPVAAFLCGFVWDALTIGQRVRPVDLWRLGAFLLGAGLLVLWLAFRESRKRAEPAAETGLRGRFAGIAWQAPYLLLQFFFGGIFSALFILYFKSSGHLGTWLTATILGALLVGNEFAGRRYGQYFTLIWAMFALNAILFFNFALPHAVGSLNSWWFYVLNRIRHPVDSPLVADFLRAARADTPLVGVGGDAAACMVIRHDRARSAGQTGSGCRARIRSGRHAHCSEGGTGALLATLA